MFLPHRLMPPRIFSVLLLLTAGALGPVMSQTAQVPDLYSASVPVPDTSAGSRIDGFRAALGRVLIKLSGSGDILESPATGPILDKAPGYALRYSYEDRKSTAAGSDEDNEGLYLKAEFDGPALERAMHSAGLPIWGVSRPTTLVWLGVESGGDRFIAAEDGDSAVIKPLREAAAMRGVPLILPLMDLEDRRRVEYADIRAGFTENLLNAAERYNTAGVMIGSLRQLRSGEWVAKWTVHGDKTSSSWSEQGVSLAEALRSGVGGLTDILAARYAFSAAPGAGDSEYLLAVDQLGSLDDYAGILNLLNQFVFVHQAMPVRVEENRMYFRVRMSGQVRELERALTLSNLLKPAPSGHDRDRAPPAVTPAPAGGATAVAAQQSGGADLYYSVRR